MRRTLSVSLLLSVLAAWPAAAGQATTDKGAGVQPTPSAEAAAPVEDAELRAFAAATALLQGTSKTTDEQRAVVEQAGLTVERYNQISEAVRLDPAVLRRVQVLMQPAAARPEAPQSQGTAPPPAPPKTGDGAALLQVLDKICVPAVEADQEVAKLAPAAGFKRNRRDGAYHKALGRKPYEIIVAPRGANQAVCSVQVRYAIGGEGPLREALHIWALNHSPEMKQVRSDVVDGPDGVKRTTLSWEGRSPSATSAMVFVELKARDGSALDRDFDQATLLYTMSPA